MNIATYSKELKTQKMSQDIKKRSILYYPISLIIRYMCVVVIYNFIASHLLHREEC